MSKIVPDPVPFLGNSSHGTNDALEYIDLPSMDDLGDFEKGRFTDLNVTASQGGVLLKETHLPCSDSLSTCIEGFLTPETPDFLSCCEASMASPLITKDTLDTRRTLAMHISKLYNCMLVIFPSEIQYRAHQSLIAKTCNLRDQGIPLEEAMVMAQQEFLPLLQNAFMKMREIKQQKIVDFVSNLSRTTQLNPRQKVLAAAQVAVELAACSNINTTSYTTTHSDTSIPRVLHLHPPTLSAPLPTSCVQNEDALRQASSAVASESCCIVTQETDYKELTSTTPSDTDEQPRTNIPMPLDDAVEHTAKNPLVLNSTKDGPEMAPPFEPYQLMIDLDGLFPANGSLSSQCNTTTSSLENVVVGGDNWMLPHQELAQVSTAMSEYTAMRNAENKGVDGKYDDDDDDEYVPGSRKRRKKAKNRKAGNKMKWCQK